MQTEYELTCQVAQYLDLLQSLGKVKLYSHIPNETFTKSWSVKMKNKKQGVHKGVPDFIIIFRHSVFFLELKKEKGGSISPEQRQWIYALQDLGSLSVNAEIAKGWDEAKKAIDQYL